MDPEDAELLFRKAVIHRHRGEPADAARCWRTILTLYAARAVRQRGHGDLRPPDPSQPGGAGRRARGSGGRGAALAGRARRMPGRPRGAGEATTVRERLGADRRGMTRPRSARGADRPGNGESHARQAFERDRLCPHPMRSAAEPGPGSKRRRVPEVPPPNRSHEFPKKTGPICIIAAECYIV